MNHNDLKAEPGITEDIEMATIHHGEQSSIEYTCTRCGVTDCKLWRQYQAFLNHIELMCVDCAAKDQDMKLVDLGPNGLHTDKFGRRTDQIGWMIPACPTVEFDTFWGYTSVPEDRIAWWQSLPLRKG